MPHLVDKLSHWFHVTVSKVVVWENYLLRGSSCGAKVTPSNRRYIGDDQGFRGCNIFSTKIIRSETTVEITNSSRVYSGTTRYTPSYIYIVYSTARVSPSQVPGAKCAVFESEFQSAKHKTMYFCFYSSLKKATLPAFPGGYIGTVARWLLLGARPFGIPKKGEEAGKEPQRKGKGKRQRQREGNKK